MNTMFNVTLLFILICVFALCFCKETKRESEDDDSIDALIAHSESLELSIEQQKKTISTLQKRLTKLESILLTKHDRKLKAMEIKLSKKIKYVVTQQKSIDKKVLKFRANSKKTKAKMSSLQKQISQSRAESKKAKAKMSSLQNQINQNRADSRKTKAKTSSLQQQINQNKCQSGVVQSHYTRHRNMNSVHRVSFKRRFTTVPNVVIGLKLFDSYHRHNARLNTFIYNVARSGFNIRITSWAGTLMYQAQYFWMACP